MSKIKAIQSLLLKNPSKYAQMRLLVSKQIFTLSFTLYFLTILFTIGGFYFWPFNLNTLAKISFHLYSLLVIATAFFAFSLVEYFCAIYANNNKIFLIISSILILIFSIGALVLHLGIF